MWCGYVGGDRALLPQNDCAATRVDGSLNDVALSGVFSLPQSLPVLPSFGTWRFCSVPEHGIRLLLQRSCGCGCSDAAHVGFASVHSWGE